MKTVNIKDSNFIIGSKTKPAKKRHKKITHHHYVYIVETELDGIKDIEGIFNDVSKARYVAIDFVECNSLTDFKSSPRNTKKIEMFFVDNFSEKVHATVKRVAVI